MLYDQLQFVRKRELLLMKMLSDVAERYITCVICQVTKQQPRWTALLFGSLRDAEVSSWRSITEAELTSEC